MKIKIYLILMRKQKKIDAVSIISLLKENVDIRKIETDDQKKLMTKTL